MSFVLELSNERIESSLEQNLPSSASFFEPILSPSLDLNFLKFLRSTQLDCCLKNFQIDSYPLTIIRQEHLTFKLEIPISLTKANSIFDDDIVNQKNNKPLVIQTSDFLAHNNQQTTDYINNLFRNQLNSYIIARYLELCCDDDSIFTPQAFDGLNYEQKNTLSFKELSLLRHYIDCAIFCRLTSLTFLNELINSGRRVTDLIDVKEVKYTDEKYSVEEETAILESSTKLRSLTERNKSETKLIDFSQFNGISLNHTSNQNERSTIMNNIRGKTRDMIIILKVYDGRRVLPQHYTFIENMIQTCVKVIKLALQTGCIIEQEKARHEQESKKSSKRPKRICDVFTPDFIQLELDSTKQKCKFIVSQEKIFEETRFQMNFPKYLSYKLGTTRNEMTGEYESIQVGPISGKKINPQNLKRITNKITVGEIQSLGSAMRCQPKLICIASDIFQQSGRAQERDIFFSKDKDFITIYRQEHRQDNIDFNFLFKKENDTVRYFQLEENRSILQGLKLKISDENGECLKFSRNTITKISLGFRPTPLDE